MHCEQYDKRNLEKNLGNKYYNSKPSMILSFLFTAHVIFETTYS